MSRPSALAGDSGAEGERVVSFRVPAVVPSLRLLRRLVREAAVTCGCGEACTRDVVIAVDEACQNVIQHAYGGSGDGDIVVEVRRAGDRLVVNVVDYAPPVDPKRVRPRPLEELRPGGLGTHFIRECMDASEFRAPPEGAGNRLWMEKKIE